jgi:hypothetical protein
MKKILTVVQSFYIPWKGYFDLINSADELILYDDMQYRRRFWINRNKIKTAQGITWLTIPLQVKGRFTQAIKDTVISDPQWNRRHWETLKRSYSRAAHFREVRELFEELYLNCRETHISQINRRFLTAIFSLLGIRTPVSWSMDYSLIPGKTARLVDLCRQKQADVYLTGPTARQYIDEHLFREAGIELRYMDYSNYPEYPQFFPPFTHEVSILDLIFHTGDRAPEYMKSFHPDEACSRL